MKLKSLPMNLRGAKKIDTDGKSSTFKLKTGHEIKVFHEPLSALHKKQIEAMPIQTVEPQQPDKIPSVKQNLALYGNELDRTHMFAVGGLQDAEDAQDHAATGFSPDDQTVVQPISKETDRSPASQKQPPMSKPTGVAALPPKNEPDPYGLNAQYQEQLKALELQKKAEQQMQESKARVAQAQVGAEQQRQGNVWNLMEHYKNNLAHLQSQDELFQQDVAKGLDPNRFLKNMDTGDKIKSTIGMILGGFGASKIGGPNLGYQALQQHIQNDIDAQKFNLNKGQNLLSHNLALMGNLKDATTLTQIQLGDIADSYMRQKTAEEGTPVANAQKLLIESQWRQKKAELQHNLAVNQALLAPTNDPEQGFQNRMQWLRMNGMHDMAKDMESKHVPGISGQASIPVSTQDREARQHLGFYESALNEAEQYLNDVGSLGAIAPGTRAKGKSIMEQLVLEMGQLQNLQRFTPAEAEHYKALVPDLTGTHFTSSDAQKLQQLKKELQHKKEAWAKSYGLNYQEQPEEKIKAKQPLQAGEQRMISKKTGKIVVVKNGKIVRVEE